MEEFFYLLKCKSVEELLFLYDFKEGQEYEVETREEGIEVIKIPVNSDRAKCVIEVIKDIDIFIPKVGKYLSDYLLLKETPTKAIVNYLGYFKSDELFLPYISKSRVYKAQITHCKRFNHLQWANPYKNPNVKKS